MSLNRAPPLAVTAPPIAEARQPDSANTLLRAQELVASQLARARAGRRNGADESSVPVVACERVYRVLTRTLGRIGAHAIFSRALATTRIDHPSLESIRVDRESEDALVDVAAVMQAHGAPVVGDALESLLENAFILLEKMVGPEMVARLLESSDASDTPEDEDTT